MSNHDMTFHESYGPLPKSTLRLIKRHNVSPADWNLIFEYLACPSWDEVNDHIRDNSATGMYVCLFV